VVILQAIEPLGHVYRAAITEAAFAMRDFDAMQDRSRQHPSGRSAHCPNSRSARAVVTCRSNHTRLWVHPFFVGSGGPEDLLHRDSRVTRLTLADTTVLKSG
jgi:hypothetical protein